MKALLRKDFYLSIRVFRSTFLIMLIFFVMGLIVRTSNMDFMATYITMYLVSLPVGIISIEEQEKWHQFVRTLPLSIKQVVLEKYVLSAILMAIGATLGAILLSNHHLSSSYIFLVQAVTLFGLGMFLCVIEIPLIYIFGPNKFRMVQMVILIAAILLAVRYSQELVNFMTISYLPWILVVGLVVGIVLSYLCSVKAYEGREFQ